MRKSLVLTGTKQHQTPVVFTETLTGLHVFPFSFLLLGTKMEGLEQHMA